MLSSCRSASPAAAGSSLGRRSEICDISSGIWRGWAISGWTALLAGGLLAPSTMRMSWSYQTQGRIPLCPPPGRGCPLDDPVDGDAGGLGIAIGQVFLVTRGGGQTLPPHVTLGSGQRTVM